MLFWKYSQHMLNVMMTPCWVSSLVWFPLAKSAKMLKKNLAFPHFDYHSRIRMLLHGHLTFAKPAKISHSIFANVQANSRFAMVRMASGNPALIRKRYLHYWPFMKGIYQSFVDSLHKHGGVSYCVLRCELTTSVDFPYFSCCKMDPRQTHDSDSRRKQPQKRYLVQFLQQINAAKVRLVR